MNVDQAAIKGEPGTGYEGPAGGPFECSNCEYFRASDSSCGQETMMQRSKLPRLDRGMTSSSRVVVDPAGCCEYVDRKGKASPQRSYFKSKK